MSENISTIFNNNNSVSSDADQFYKNYWTEGPTITKRTKEKNLKIIDYYFPSGLSHKTILEIGVGGEGGIIYPLREQNIIEGVDVSESAIKNCKSLGLNIRYINMDSDQLPFPENNFDVIFAFEVFEHFSNPQAAIEEIYRVLKSDGQLIISTPTTLTYHWPRLFYPSLFEKVNFKEFLIINGFSCELNDLCLFKNMHHLKNIPELDKMWSWFWNCKKIDMKNSQKLYNYGLYFWEQKNDSNLRIKPLEAIEFFRKAYQNTSDDYRLKLTFAQSLLYRFYLGDLDEFNSILNSINSDLEQLKNQQNCDFLYRFLLIDTEARHLTTQGFDENLIKNIRALLTNLPESKEYLANVSSEILRLQID